jgi:hypothetical protein
MRTRTIIGAEAAYACIQHGHVSMDIKLHGGCSAAKSLARTVGEMRAKAAELSERADFIDAAITFFE